jgi:2-C-methyl-D-erythritol 4-phosphate cytidylyltransferase
VRTVAVVLAGGVGERIGLQIPKQLVKVAGRSIMEHTIAALSDCAEIDELVLLMTADWVDTARSTLGSRYPKLSRIVAGGATRNESTRIALDALGEVGDEDRKVIFHDAVRPLVDQRIVTECVEALDSYRAVDVVIPSADTIVVVEDGVISEIPSRDRLRRGQTPQAFHLSTIRQAYDLAWQDPDFAATDDCSVVLKYLPEVPIAVVTGAEHNIKITHPIDVFIADKLFQLASRQAPALTEPQYREGLAGRTVVVFGGGHGIGGDLSRMCRTFGADVFAHSRSLTGTHVESAEEVAAALAGAHATTGRIDHVVVSAGVLRIGRLAGIDEEQLMETLNINYLAPVRVAQAAHRYLAETGGSLLLFTSSSYTRGRSEYSLYSSTKAAVVNLTQALAEEWAEDGVQVNVINPERTATPMRARAFGEEPAGSLLSSDAVALTCIDVMLSDLTGQVVDVRRQRLDGTFDGHDAESVATALTPRSGSAGLRVG